MNGLRGIRTLPVRVERQSATALRLAEWLEAHPAVAGVRYPHLPSHPQHDLAKRQMAYGGGILAVDLRRRAGRREGLRRSRCAWPAWPPRSVVPRRWSSSPANSTHVGLSDAELEAAGIGPGLIRVSVGLEHVDDLRADFAQALG